MSQTPDIQTALHTQTAVAADLARLGLEHTQKAWGLVNQTLDEGFRDSQLHLQTLAEKGPSALSDLFATASETFSANLERNLQLGRALWTHHVETAQVAGDLVRDRFQTASATGRPKATNAKR